MALKHNYYTIGICAVIGFVFLVTSTSQYSKSLSNHIQQQEQNMVTLNHQINQQSMQLNYIADIPGVTVDQIKHQTQFILTQPNTLNNVFHKGKYRNMLVVDVDSTAAKAWLHDANISNNLPTDPVVVSTSHKTTYDAKSVDLSVKSIPAASSATQNTVTNQINALKRKKASIKKHTHNNRVIKAILRTIDYIAFIGILILTIILTIISYHQNKKEA